ncbi:MAG: flagellar basal body-associated FliL family protein, partial [Acidimicrobiaceae bacterium]|nr:flagellar basal body-associated FliL family protein [Acidimicrobiaceae bacterium]
MKINFIAVLCIVLTGCGKQIQTEKLVGHWVCIEDAGEGKHPVPNMSFSSAGRFNWVLPSKVSTVTAYASADYVLDGPIIKMPEIWVDVTGIPYDTSPGPKKSSRSVTAKITELTDTSLKMVWTSTSSQRKVSGDGTEYDCKRNQQETSDSTSKEKNPTVASPPAAVASSSVTVDLQSFTVNLQPENGEQFLQTTITLSLNGANNTAPVNARIPELRNTLLLVLSSKKASDLSTPTGKQMLVKELVQAIKSLP